MLRKPLQARRASLSLSINAIVIIVLAMTLLGLGLGFIRGLFKNITETTGTVTEQVRQQILEDLKTGDKKLSFSTNSLQMESSGSQTITIGARNSKSSAAPMGFIIYVETLQYKPTSGDKVTCSRNTIADGIDPSTFSQEDDKYLCKQGSVDQDRSLTDIDNIDFFYDMGPYQLTADEANVYPVRITSKAGTKGTYLVKISVLEDSNDNGANNPPGNGMFGEKNNADSANEVYAEKTFFITVT